MIISILHNDKKDNELLPNNFLQARWKSRSVEHDKGLMCHQQGTFIIDEKRKGCKFVCFLSTPSSKFLVQVHCVSIKVESAREMFSLRSILSRNCLRDFER